MGNKITVSFFKCDTRKGNELFRQTKNMLEAMDIGGKGIEVVLRRNDPFTAIEAYLCDDVIIFDGSLEDQGEDGESNIGQQYDAMIEPMKSSSHVLIVARSQVPFNVMCVRKGGYPKYVKTGVSRYKEHLDNKEIIKWIKNMFTEHDGGLLNSRKVDRKYYQGLSDQQKAELLEEIIQKDSDESELYSGGDMQVFISYLSRYSMYFPGPKQEKRKYTVEDLIEYISKTQGIPLEQIGYFPPGSLSRELMTVQRRWEIVSVTDDFIRGCKQFWILASPGYEQSWWTLSEQMTLSYILAENPAECPDIYVAKYDAKSGCFRVKKYLDPESKKRFLPKIDEDTRREMARRFANSRPGTVGYESIWLMKLKHHLPGPAIRFLSRQEYKMMEKVMPSVLKNLGETMEEYEGDAVKSCKSNVYTNSFWEDWVMECPYCKARSGDNHYGTETFLAPETSRFCQVVKKQRISYDAGRDKYTATCRTCKHEFYFEKGAFYRWYPIRGGGVHTGPGGKSIEKKTAFYFAEEK